MTVQTTTTEPRVPLTRERVLRAAIDVADKAGFESVTMRKLGKELGVEAMSLYNHVANKDEIRDGIVEIVMEEIEVPERAAHWKTAIRASAISAHEVLLSHPWACSLMTQATNVSPARLRWMEGVLGSLRTGGFSEELTHHAYHVLDSHITGFTLWQVSFPFETTAELAELAERFLRELPRDEYPYLAEHIEYHIEEARSPDDGTGEGEFEFGLDLILDGLERLRDAG